MSVLSTSVKFLMELQFSGGVHLRFLIFEGLSSNRRTERPDRAAASVSHTRIDYPVTDEYKSRKPEMTDKVRLNL